MEFQAEMIAFHPNGNTVFLPSWCHQIVIWNFFEDNCYARQTENKNGNLTTDLGLLKHGKEMIVGTEVGMIARFNLNIFLRIDVFQEVFMPENDDDSGVSDFAMSANGGHVAALAHDQNICVWNTKTGVKIARHKAPNSCTHLALSQNGEMMVTSTLHGEIHVWRTDQPFGAEDLFDLGEKIQAGSGLCLCPDGQTLAHVGEDQEVRLLDLTTRSICGVIRARSNTVDRRSISHVSFSRDGRYIIFGSSSARATIWEAATKRMVFGCAVLSEQPLSLADAQNVIRNCGPLASILWPFSGKPECSRLCPAQALCSAKTLDVDTIFSFVPYNKFSRNAKFCRSSYATAVDGRIGIFKLDTAE